MNIQFNPALVKEYRLIGYDNKKNVVADSTSVLEGGEIGSAHGITAVFEIVPATDSIPQVPLTDSIAAVQINYCLPHDSTKIFETYTCRNNLKNFYSLSPALRFATSITMFGLLLRNSIYAPKATWAEVEKMAKESKDPDDYLQAEFLTIVENAKKVYSKKGRRKFRVRDNNFKTLI